MATNFKPIQLQPFTLAGAGCVIGDTSITFSSMTDIGGVALAMSDFGTVGFMTLEPTVTTSQEEAIQFTGLTQNANGTATITGVSNTGFKYPYTVTSGVLKTHAGGTKAVVSNTAAYYNKFLILDDAETVTQVITFASGATPIITDAPVNPTDASNKAYIDGIAIAGSPVATIATLGIAKLSSISSTPATPVVVETGDTRVPTANQTAALAGTSGTAPSGANKFVDNGDTATVATASKVVRALPSGLIDPSFLPAMLLQSMTATGAITAGQAVVTGYGQTDGGIQIDTSAVGGQFLSQPATASIPIAVNTNRGLLLFLSTVGGTSGNSISAVTYNSVALTLVQSQSWTDINGKAQLNNVYYLVAPATGTNTLSITWSGSGGGQALNYAYYSLYNVAQTQPEASAKINSNTSLSVTTVANAARVFGVAYPTNSAITVITGTGTWKSSTSGSNLWGTDSGAVIPAGSVSILPNQNYAGTMVSIAPITAPILGVHPASSAAATYSSIQNDYDTFMGFAQANISAGVAGNIIVDGVVTGLSGLAIGSRYYLNNTNGTIGTSAGTNTRKVGIAVSTTALLITNIW